MIKRYTGVTLACVALVVSGLLSVFALPIFAADDSGWVIDGKKPPAGAAQPNGGPNGPGGADNPGRAAFMDRGEMQRLILGLLELEKKDKKLAITKAQAKVLKPLVASIKKDDVLNLKNPTANFGNRDRSQSGSNQGTQAQRGPSGPELEKLKKISATLEKMNKTLTSKQLGAIDAMTFPDLQLGRFNGARNQGQTGGVGRFLGQGQGQGQGQRPDEKTLEKMRKEMQDRQVKLAAKLTKSLNDLISLLDKKLK